MIQSPIRSEAQLLLKRVLFWYDEDVMQKDFPPMFMPLKNPSPEQLKDLLRGSKHQAARRIHDERSGDLWYWDFDQATHAEGAEKLGVPYSRRPGEGDVVFL